MSPPNANPDALRKLANLILRGMKFQEIAVAEALRACADTWQSQQEQYAVLFKAHGLVRDEMDRQTRLASSKPKEA